MSIYRQRVENEQAVIESLKRIGRRKGRLVPFQDLLDGDIFRDSNDRWGGKVIYIFHIREKNMYSVFSAWEELMGYLATGYGGELARVPRGYIVRRLATKHEYIQPEKEPALKTFIHPREDGTFCCQNMIYFQLGQHFRINAHKLAELEAKHDRKWIRETQPCTCNLKVGQVREYDGKVHSL